MGLLSTVTIKHPLPAGYENLQDKSFLMSDDSMGEYTITAEGQLIDHQTELKYNKAEHDANIEAGHEGWAELAGVFDTVYAGDEIIEDIHCDWHVWYDAGDKPEFVIRWNNGRVQYIRKKASE